MSTKNSLEEKFILGLVDEQIKDASQFLKYQRLFSKLNKSSFLQKDDLVLAYHNLVKSGTIEKNKGVEGLIKMKETRSLSGIVVVSVLTKPYDCPGHCIYCPSQSNIPKSYLANEPAVMRAIACNYHPYKQVISRLKALRDTGHPTDKINIRVIGGTWSYYPKQYQSWFIKRLFDACNEFGGEKTSSISLATSQSINETASNRIVEISIETRQDYLDDAEILRLRKFGVTKVEIGVQSIYDDVLDFNKRGILNDETIRATKLLRNAGFKVAYQVMLNLPLSNPQRDEEMFAQIFGDERYKPDYLKIYPLALVEEAPIFELYKQNKFKPYNKDDLIEVIAKIKEKIPYFCRVERIIRDIPANSIVEGGSKVSNLRQEVVNQLAVSGKKCNCIRCREVRNNQSNDDVPQLFREDYEASGGKEIFLSFENKERTKLYSMLRLRIVNSPNQSMPNLKNSAIIREIHTYGPQTAIGSNNEDATQHKGFGKMLLNSAEKITKEEFGLAKISVISGVGVREYFRKFGYELDQTYMSKNL